MGGNMNILHLIDGEVSTIPLYLIIDLLDQKCLNSLQSYPFIDNPQKNSEILKSELDTDIKLLSSSSLNGHQKSLLIADSISTLNSLRLLDY